MIDEFNAFAASRRIPDGVRRTFDIAFDELLNNVISYGFDDAERHEIEVELWLEDQRIVATISDDARPFDPFSLAAPDTELGVEEREIGGLGVYLVTQMMETATYERRGDRNRVTIAKGWGDPEPEDHDKE